ncbi:class I SAM-dependent methyltransferase [Aliiruegeria sabulilitoris]|uniref:class I SAM-dependent methyltransferase n=1 Tax=Aliiruegeria sabulilitoris TaxID=1510458 RepID=UPI00083042D4|nr:SAM-dependent methyltransferase [Aliiruegeria sabulilitoris]NDR58966.1 class I SAM-dependent methyltransferase [Pseudoruegeria sp. M32A2M]
MNTLADILRRRIAHTGPMTLAEYMAECLLHPEHGYYTNETVFGAEGDFVTAPEISQMFGELLGLALAQAWMDQGAPAPAVLAEAGPGRGTLMSDMLRAMRPVPGLLDALDIRLVEASPKLRAKQKDTLSNHHVSWLETVRDLPEAPLFFVANEFLDALPIRQFVRRGQAWSERLVREDGDRFAVALTEPAPFAELDHRLADTRDGDIVEYCPSLPFVVSEIAGRIARNGGLALLVDYGDWRSRGDTFQAVRDHQPVDPFAAPGTADLTAHVDFEAIARVACAEGTRTTPMVSQGLFLEHLGITQRAQSLARAMPNPKAMEEHIAAHRRLTHPQEMGSLFKAIAIHPTGAPTPAGFET